MATITIQALTEIFVYFKFVLSTYLPSAKLCQYILWIYVNKIKTDRDKFNFAIVQSAF